MLGRIALFELRYQLRRPIALISFLLFATLGFVLETGAALNSGNIANAPKTIAEFLGFFSILAMFLSLATLADVALRDIATGMDAIMRTQPVRSVIYFGGRFAGAYAVACLAFLGTALGIGLATYMPWVPANSVGPFHPVPYVTAAVAMALPNLFITGALFFGVASLTRSLLATYLSALVFFIIYVTSQVLLSSQGSRAIAALADPFGLVALTADTVYWTNAEKNTSPIPLAGLLLWNRLLWIGVGCALLAVSLPLLATRERRPPKRRLELEQAAISPVMRARPALVPGGAGFVDQLMVRTRFEIGSILRSWTFFGFLLLAIAACIGALLARNEYSSAPDLPVTYIVVEIVASAFSFVALLVPIAYGGELIWRDRKIKMAAIIDATPTPSAVLFLSKIIAVVLAVFLILVVGAATGIGYQLINGVTDIDIGFYLLRLFGLVGLPAVMFGVLALFIQTLVNQKFVGLLIVLVLIIAVPLAGYFGIGNGLLLLFEIPNFTLSDMNRYGHFLARTLWFSAYWTCVAVLIAVATQILWIRGEGSLWTRLKTARHAITPALASIAGVALAGTAASAGYIYWNTHVLNDFITGVAAEQAKVEYEKAYRSVEKEPQPRIADIDIEVDLEPEERGFRTRGRYVLVNRSDKPIEKVHVDFGSGTADAELQDAELIDKQPRFGVIQFRPKSPFLPGETRTLTFSLSDRKRGFQSGANVTPVVYNGSFVHSAGLAPAIGVQRDSYVQSASRRRVYGLEPLPGLARRDDQEALRRNFLSSDSDFVNLAVTVSTSADQIALAPGSLEREWTQDNRRFARFRPDKPVANFWSVVSARYAIARDKWNDVDLAVYYHPAHGVNVPRMLDGMKEALSYYTANFGPYPHRQIRIAEFPRYESFAQSFPAMIPYSESIGFIADLRDPATIDEVWHVTAHEVAHQWWGHQVIGADVEGAQFLSESLSEYSALMVAEHRYGPHKMRQYLKRELDSYLRQRGDYSNERPLARAAMDQQAVHYQKGSLTFYALKDAIGEAALNRALAQFLREQGYKTDPYPTSLNLLALLRREAGRAHGRLISDLFERITLWDLSVAGSEATEAPGGKWRVRVDLKAKKLDATGNGTEKEAPLDQLIDIGLFTADPDKSEFGEKDVIVLEKRRIKSGAQTLEFEVDRKPAFVGIDPYVKLISRDTSGNVAPLGRKGS